MDVPERLLTKSVTGGLQEHNAFPNGIKQWHGGQKQPMGEDTATYGEPRLGVGWRENA